MFNSENIKNKKYSRICFTGASFDTNNMGVGTLAAGFMKGVLYVHPNAEVVFFNYGKIEDGILYYNSFGKQVSIRRINMSFSKNIFLRNHVVRLLVLSLIFKLVRIKKIREILLRKNKILDILYNSSLTASVAAGDSFSDIYGFMNFLYVSLPNIITLLLEKDLVLLPQTFGPFNGPLTRIIARFILNRAKYVYSRDFEGIETVKKICKNHRIKEKLAFCYDLGFVMDPEKPDLFPKDFHFMKGRKNYVLVGLNINGMLYRGGYSEKIRKNFGFRDGYKDIVYSIIESLMKRAGVSILFIPHVFGSHFQSDETASLELYTDLITRYDDRLHYIKQRFNQAEIKYVIGLCDFFIGSRMHSCIAALSQAIPSVAIAYSDKFIGVITSIGFPDLVADPRIMDKEKILEVIRNGYSRRKEITSILKERIPVIKNDVMDLFTKIKL